MAELEVYDEYLDAIRVRQTVIEDSYEEGREEERQNYLEEKKSMVRMMVQEGMDIEKNSRITGFST